MGFFKKQEIYNIKITKNDILKKDVNFLFRKLLFLANNKYVF